MGLRYRPDSDGNLRRFRRPSCRAASAYESQMGRSAGNLDGDESSGGRFELVASNAVLLAEFSREYLTHNPKQIYLIRPAQNTLVCYSTYSALIVCVT